jgi:hypothetical protein
MDTHSCDSLHLYIMCTKHLPFSLYLYSNLTEMSSSLGLVSSLTQMDLSVYTNFPLNVGLLIEPQPDSGISTASKDTLIVAIKS